MTTNLDKALAAAERAAKAREARDTYIHRAVTEDGMRHATVANALGLSVSGIRKILREYKETRS